MIRYFFTLFLLLTCYGMNAQDLIQRTQLGKPHVTSNDMQANNGLAKTLQAKKQSTASSRNTNSYPLFKLANQNQALPRTISKGIRLDLDATMLTQLRREKRDLLTLSIPVSDAKSFELDLYQESIYADGFNVTTSAPSKQTLKNTGIFYHGIIKGNPNSLVAVSLFNDILDVYIQDDSGVYKVAQNNSTDNYLLYNHRDKIEQKKHTCKTNTDAYEQQVGEQATPRSSENSIVGVYVEADYLLYQARGEDEGNTKNFVETMFNETMAIYARLEIPIRMTQLKIFNTQDPYPVTEDSTPKLEAFAIATKNNFTGTLAHLLTAAFGGGEAIDLGVLCKSYEFSEEDGANGPYAVSGVDESDAAMPDPDDINTFAHELGHNFGSPHTQSCSWNDNNTALDGCVNPEEDEDEEGNVFNCVRPSTNCPAGGGTIMSYCSTPDDPIEDCEARNNWHPQVGDLLKARYAEALAEGCLKSGDDTDEGDDTDDGDDTDMDTTPLDMEILSQMQTNNIPSISIGVLGCKALSWSKSYGNYDIPNQKPATENTIYTLASLTKVVTATAVFHLMEKDSFQLDDDINKYLPYDITHPDYPNTPITFRMLLQHTSGIIDNDLIYEGYTDGDHPESLSDFVYKYLNPEGDNYEVFENFSDNQPGAKEEYSNTGITLLGYLVEVISKTPFNEYCNTNLFTPMGMNNTRFFLSELNTSNVAIPYTREGQTYETEGQYGFPDYPNGLLRSTVNDLSNFFSMYLNNGSYNGQQILTPQSIELLTPTNSDQGHTWFESSDIIPSGNRSWGHSGLEIGTITLAVLDHGSDGAVILLTNGSDQEDLNKLTFWSKLWDMTSDCNTTSVTDIDQDGFDNTVDCDDNNAQINPNQTEIPYNGIDDDCNAMTLDDDLDQDGFAMAMDCDDTNAAINPNATEVADNGIDEDCNGQDAPAADDDDNDDDGGNNDGDDNNDDEQAAWTMLIYLNGSDLESDGNAGTSDLAEMVAANSTENVNIIVLTGGAKKEGWETLKSWKIENGEQMALDFTPMDNNMSNPQNLTDFINWGIENYPAEKYMLDLWNHGMDIRGYGHDENTDEEIKIPTLKASIGNSNFIQANNRFELLGFDACLMATIEVQSTLANFANYFVGSEETEPGHGWNYTPVLNAMEDGTAKDGATLGTIIADNFKAQAIAENTENVTLSVVDLAQIPPLVNALENLVNTLKSGGSATIQSLQAARAKAEEYSPSIKEPTNSEDMVDIGDLMKKLKQADPSLNSVANEVLTALNNAVVYNIKDQTRPNATGISMFIPHNKFADEDAVFGALDENYLPIDFSTIVKSFVNGEYVDLVLSDNNPPSGEEYEDNEIGLRGHHPKGRSGNTNSTFSSVRVTNTDDLEEVRVVLEATSFLGENEFVLLGSTFPDTCYYLEDGSEVFGYMWDEYWLSINTYPAYIADIYDYEIVDDMGDTTFMTRVQIPAVLNPATEDKDIIISYVFDDNFDNITLENIVPESYGETVELTAKERIQLKPGDQIQLLYEGFNEATDEEFYVVDDAAIFDIENGESDLELDYDFLEEGDYILGYLLTDYSQNDTIIYDSKTFSIASSTVESFAMNNITLSPNPTTGQLSIDYPDFGGKSYRVELYDLAGRISYQNAFEVATANLNLTNLPDGYYLVKLISQDKIFSDKVIIQR